jgi:glycosyltransferase involved in cell wall biosynthesis
MSNVAVTLCLGSGFYSAGLAETLLSQGRLVRAIRLTPKMEVLEPDGESLRTVEEFPVLGFLERVMWAIWRRAPFTGQSHLPILVTSHLADYVASRRIRPANVFHGITGNALRSFAEAKQLGAVTVLEHPMVHPRRWQLEVLEECSHFGVHPRKCHTVLPEPLIRRREREYQLSDRIVVPSSFARSSFEQERFSNAEVILPGIDECLFHPPNRRGASQLFRVCYTGRLELGKGVLYLIEAWKRLRLKNAELLLIGAVRPEIKETLTALSSDGIRITGFLPREIVAQQLRQSSLFVFPSLHEGLAQSLLEAMASGLPVIATPNAGAEDCITTGQDGFVVQARDVAELAESILWCYRNRDALEPMGKNARAKVESVFTMNSYRARMTGFYEGLERVLLGKRPRGSPQSLPHTSLQPPE